MTSLINLAFDENGQKAAKIDLSKFKFKKYNSYNTKKLDALINEDYRQVKPKPKNVPLQPKARLKIRSKTLDSVLFESCSMPRKSYLDSPSIKPPKVKR